MAITRAQYTGTVRDNFTGITLAFASNVANGSLAVIRVSKWSGSGSDPFALSDLSKSSGTATIGTITLDKQAEYNISGAYYINTAIYSVPITGAGSLEFTISGAVSGSYLAMSVEELSGDIDVSATRVAGTNSGSGASGAPDGGNVTVTGGGVIAGSLVTNGVASTTHTEDAAFTLIYESEDGANHQTASFISRISASTLTDSASWTAPTTLEWVAAVVAYKIVGSGQTVTLGLLSETDTIQADSRTKSKDLGQLSETETVQTASRVKSVAMGQLSETSTIQQDTRTKTKGVAQLSTTEQLLSVVTAKLLSMGLLQGDETIQPLNRLKNVSLSQLVESDSIFAVSSAKLLELGQLSEINTLFTIATSGAYVLGLLTESNSLLSISGVKEKTIGQLQETNELFALVQNKTVSLGILSETGTLFSITSQGEIVYTLGLLTETGTLLRLVRDIVAHYTYVVPAENRIYIVPFEDIETPEDRKLIIPAENRVYEVTDD